MTETDVLHVLIENEAATVPFKRMNDNIASDVLHLVGSGSLLHYGCTSLPLIQQLMQRGCDAFGYVTSADAACKDFSRCYSTDHPFPEKDPSFTTVVVDPSLIAQCTNGRELFEKLRPLCRRFIVLWYTGSGAVAPAAGRHEYWANQAVLAGYRRHPGSFSVERYRALNDPALEVLSCFEKLDDAILRKWPLDLLLRDRDLHMDMSRESGARADAHLVRYALACQWIRRGDSVLDCACGLGYGSALMAGRSLGEQFVGVDIDPTSIDYARDMFSNYGVEYRASAAACLDFIPDSSIDVVTSFETIEHLDDFEAFLDEISRVLKPDGRLIVSAPNLWIDASGEDPNPYHHHVFDYPQLRAVIERRFLIEARYEQTAPGGFKLPNAQRHLKRLDLTASQSDADTEWVIIVASANPLTAKGQPYRHPEFDRSDAGESFHVTAFGRYYQNPWLYRPLVQIGERIDDPALLLRITDDVLSEADHASPDYGAALTVKGYFLLANDGEIPSVQRTSFLNLCDAYLSRTATGPHQTRWQTSLAYLAGKHVLRAGDRPHALAYFNRAMEFDPQAFSPLLATKAISAAFEAGMLHLADGSREQALASFLRGIDIGRRSLHAPDINAIGNPAKPLSFGFQELADVAEAAARCALALRHLHSYERDPGRFVRLVDVRRAWRAADETSAALDRQALHALSVAHGLVEELHHESTALRRCINRTLDRLLGIRLVRSHMLDKLGAVTRPPE